MNEAPSPADDRRVQIGRPQLDAAVQAGDISAEQAERLWARWAGDAAAVVGSPRFSFTHVLYYFGGLIAIGAMTLFMTLGWELFGAWGVLLLSLGYGAGAIAVARNLLGRGLPIPAGILATLAVCLVPLATWALQTGLGLWPEGGHDSYRDYHRFIDWRWLWLELATLAAAVVMLRWLRLPFMVMPVAVTIWYLWMDLTHMLMQKGGFDWQFTRDMSLLFGIATCALAVWVDLRCRLATDPRNRQDFAFWLYLFGALMFWGGLSLRESDSELAKAGYALINVVLVFLGAAISRRVFTVLGAIGFTGYLAYLSHKVFADSLLFPFVLTLLGLAIVALGIWWQRREARIHAALAGWLPPALKPLAEG
ncbi:MAG: DUF2157 domain-containing protein [Hydrogenophaga sp.]|uniref:DUF2157 domain-containing protein n=1 Tax=Hydrogenophaga sp. TaxID=1904254 RepID=UPI001D40C530|nr:DUF2157 domain-containing protein [Hydrogenophaga sp.]MBX3611104.1 DUF2157 domain-containing protein [Hydrogenophaga sp.]